MDETELRELLWPPATYSLIIEPVPALAGLGSRVELHELSVGAVKRTIIEAAETHQSARWPDMLLGRALWIDGEPIGIERLDALPGRLTPVVTAAIKRCMVLHGYADVAGLGAGSSAQAQEHAPGEASAPSAD
jgi:hypothetical protein